MGNAIKSESVSNMKCSWKLIYEWLTNANSALRRCTTEQRTYNNLWTWIVNTWEAPVEKDSKDIRLRQNKCCISTQPGFREVALMAIELIEAWIKRDPRICKANIS